VIIKRPIYSTLQRLLGFPAQTLPTAVDLEHISPTLPVVPHVVRRSAGIRTGWYQGMLENVHSAGDAELSQINVYEPGDSAIEPYPPSVDPDLYDIWLGGVSGNRSSGTGGLTGATASLATITGHAGWGQDDAAAAAVASFGMHLAQFDAISTISGLALDPMITEDGKLFVKLGIRIPPGGTLQFHSVSVAAAEFQLSFLIGLFPAGLGQDVVT